MWARHCDVGKTSARLPGQADPSVLMGGVRIAILFKDVSSSINYECSSLVSVWPAVEGFKV